AINYSERAKLIDIIKNELDKASIRRRKRE
ncbi:unnamed protein product, partial [marine sediment metagenome]